MRNAYYMCFVSFSRSLPCPDLSARPVVARLVFPTHAAVLAISVMPIMTEIDKKRLMKMNITGASPVSLRCRTCSNMLEDDFATCRGFRPCGSSLFVDEARHERQIDDSTSRCLWVA